MIESNDWMVLCVACVVFVVVLKMLHTELG